MYSFIAKYTYLECNLSETSSAFDVEAEDGQPHVQLILNCLFTRIELFPLVDVLATRFTPAQNGFKRCYGHRIHSERTESSNKA